MAEAMVGSSYLKHFLIGIALWAVMVLEAPLSAWGQTVVPSATVNRGLDSRPDDIDNQLKETDEVIDALFPVGPLEPLHSEWKRVTDRLRRTIGLDLGLNYTALYQQSNKALPEKRRKASGGDFDFFGRWNLFDRGGHWPTAIAFSTETRHRYTDIPPSELGANIGSAWGTVSSFNIQSYAITELYWEQGSYEDQFIYRAGKVDPGHLYDGGRYVSSNYAFLSPAFSDTLAMPLPRAGLGLAAIFYPIANTYILGGLHDANGSRTSLGHIEREEYFSALEFGVTPRFGETGAGAYHVTLWHIDERRRTNVEEGRGIALTMEQELGPSGNFVPFFRYSYADGGGTAIRQTVSVGAGIEEAFGKNSDLIGLGFSWGEPTNRALKDQYVFEAFYRFNVTPHTHLTPDVQLILHPAENPDDDRILIGGIRLRTIF